MRTLSYLVSTGFSVIYGNDMGLVLWNGSCTLEIFRLSGEGEVYGLECRTLEDRPETLEYAKDEAKRFLDEFTASEIKANEDGAYDDGTTEYG